MMTRNQLVLIAAIVMISIVIITIIIPVILHRQPDRLGIILYNCAMGFERHGSLGLYVYDNGTHTIDETSCKWIKNKIAETSPPEPEPEPMPDSESLQRQKQQQAKLHVQEVVTADTRGIENKIPAIKEYRDEFESGYFLEQFIIPNKQNYEKGQVMHFIFGEWGFQPTENTSSKVTVYFRSYDNYDKIEKINEWQKPNDSAYLTSPDSDGYLMIDFHGMAPAIGIHEECVIPGEYRVSASNSGDKSKLEWGYFTCQRDNIIGETQPWMELPE